MRKDLRLGLGIGALATVFAVTFLVVRNHTKTQSTADATGAPADVGDVEGGAPEANVAVPAPGAPGNAPGGVVLPPLQEVPPGGDDAPAPPKAGPEDPFARRNVRSGETPMPGPTGKPGRPQPAADDWDMILANGRLDTGSTVTRNAPGGNRPGGAASQHNPTGRATTTRPGEQAVAPRPMLPQVGGGSREGQAAPAAGRPYTVREGDTFVSIAKAVYGNGKYYLQIEQANPQVNPNRLKPGQEIRLPELSPEARSSRQTASGPFASDDDNRPVNARSEYRVDTGDSLYRISMKLYGTPRMVNAIYDANRTAIGPNPERLRFGMILKLPRQTEQASGK